MSFLLKSLLNSSSIISRFGGGFGAIPSSAVPTVLPLESSPALIERHRSSAKRRQQTQPKKNQISNEINLAKPLQEWWDYDGVGCYKWRHHNYPNNLVLRDVQRRRIFVKYHEDRIRLNSIWKNDILPKELKDLAFRQVQDVPRATTVHRINRRCVVTGRARGIFHQFRVSRMVFRREADYNCLSGVQRAFWMYGQDIKP